MAAMLHRRGIAAMAAPTRALPPDVECAGLLLPLRWRRHPDQGQQPPDHDCRAAADIQHEEEMERQRVVLAGRASGAEEARPGRQLAHLPSLPGHREHAGPQAHQQQTAEQVQAAHRTAPAPVSLRASHSASSTANPSTPACRISNGRSEEHTSELQSLMRISYAVFCLKKNTTHSADTKTD